MNLRLRPAIDAPVCLMFSRRQIVDGDLVEPLQFFESLIGSPEQAMAYRGRLCLVIDGFNDDPRELFEIPEVRRFIQALDARWPYWFFFLCQADDSIKIVESCLCDTIEIVPGVASIDLAQMEQCLTRHFAALERLGESLALPTEALDEMSEGVIALIRNASVDRIDGDDYQ